MKSSFPLGEHLHPVGACVSLVNEKSIVCMIHFTNFQITFNTKRMLEGRRLVRSSACNQVFPVNGQHGSIYEAVQENWKSENSFWGIWSWITFLVGNLLQSLLLFRYVRVDRWESMSVRPPMTRQHSEQAQHVTKHPDKPHCSSVRRRWKEVINSITSVAHFLSQLSLMCDIYVNLIK